jgi:hypothetical protein
MKSQRKRELKWYLTMECKSARGKARIKNNCLYDRKAVVTGSNACIQAAALLML